MGVGVVKTEICNALFPFIKEHELYILFTWTTLSNDNIPDDACATRCGRLETYLNHCYIHQHFHKRHCRCTISRVNDGLKTHMLAVLASCILIKRDVFCSPRILSSFRSMK